MEHIGVILCYFCYCFTSCITYFNFNGPSEILQKWLLIYSDQIWYSISIHKISAITANHFKSKYKQHWSLIPIYIPINKYNVTAYIAYIQMFFHTLPLDRLLKRASFWYSLDGKTDWTTLVYTMCNFPDINFHTFDFILIECLQGMTRDRLLL